MKSIKAWIHTFPEPYRSKALNNCTAKDHRETASSVRAITIAFPWTQSPEGWKYWLDFKNQLINPITLKP